MIEPTRCRTLAVALLGLVAALSARSQSNAEFMAIGRLALVVHRPDAGPAPQAAVLYENGDGGVFHPMCTELAGRGFLTLCAIEQANAAAGWDNAAFHVMALIDYARRQPGVTKVVLHGHSGGGAIASFYQAVAENGIAFRQDPKKLSVCKEDLKNLPKADAVVFPDAHPGLGVMSLRMINPSLTADGYRLRVDPALDPFSRANGFNPEGPSNYPPAFQQKHMKAQAAMMNALIARALDIRARLRSGAITDATADEISIQQFGFANHLDELDASASVGNSAEAPNLAAPAAPVETSAQFLSRGAVRARNGIDDIDYRTSDEERLYERSPSADKEYVVVEGALHGGKPCTRCEKTPGQYGNSEANLYNFIRDWSNKRL